MWMPAHPLIAAAALLVMAKAERQHFLVCSGFRFAVDVMDARRREFPFEYQAHDAAKGRNFLHMALFVSSGATAFHVKPSL
jgi:hypothetical protein